MKKKIKLKFKSFWESKKSILIPFVVGFILGGLLISGVLRSAISAMFSQNESINRASLISELKDIDEWSTCEYLYNGYINKEDTKSLFGINIPLTTNEVEIIYSGKINAGYSVDETLKSLAIDNQNKTIRIKFSEPKVFDNYIKLDDLKIDGDNNILNPIDVGNLNKYFEGVEKDELAKAEKMGLYDKAKSHAQKLIKHIITNTYDYKVVFE
jgi:hypothetical protein